MKRLQLFLLLMIAVYTASAQTTPWTGSPAITFQTRTFNGAKELRAIQSPSFVFAIMDSLRAHTYTFGNGLTNTSGTVGLGGVMNQPTNILMDAGNYFTMLTADDLSAPTAAAGFRLINSSGIPTLSLTGQNLLTGVTYSNNISKAGIIFSGSNSTFSLSDSTGLYVSDFRANKKGIKYAFTDYTNLSDSSLVPKAYVDSVVSNSIQNQPFTNTPQTANFSISGIGRANTGFVVGDFTSGNYSLLQDNSLSIQTSSGTGAVIEPGGFGINSDYSSSFGKNSVSLGKVGVVNPFYNLKIDSTDRVTKVTGDPVKYTARLRIDSIPVNPTDAVRLVDIGGAIPGSGYAIKDSTLKPSKNLYDILNKPTARLNLGVQSQIYVNIKDFGVDSTGTTSSFAGIKAATNYATAHGYRNIYFPKGTYLTDSCIVRPFNINFIGDGSGSVTIKASPSATLANFTTPNTDVNPNDGLMHAVIYAGGKSTYLANIHATVSKTDYSVKAVTGLSLAQGDIIQLQDTVSYSYSKFRNYYKEGEYFHVVKYSNDTIYVDHPISGNYANVNSGEIYKMNMSQNSMSGIKVTGLPIGNLVNIMSEKVTNTIFKDVVSLNGGRSNIEFRSSYNITIDAGGSLQAEPNIIGFPNTQYGLSLINVQNLTIDGGSYYGYQHAITFAGSGIGNNVINRFNKVEGVTASSINANTPALNAHGNSEYITFTNNWTNGLGFGGNNVDILNNHILGMFGITSYNLYISEPKRLNYNVTGNTIKFNTKNIGIFSRAFSAKIDSLTETGGQLNINNNTIDVNNAGNSGINVLGSIEMINATKQLGVKINFNNNHVINNSNFSTLFTFTGLSGFKLGNLVVKDNNDMNRVAVYSTFLDTLSVTGNTFNNSDGLPLYSSQTPIVRIENNVFSKFVIGASVPVNAYEKSAFAIRFANKVYINGNTISNPGSNAIQSYFTGNIDSLYEGSNIAPLLITKSAVTNSFPYSYKAGTSGQLAVTNSSGYQSWATMSNDATIDNLGQVTLKATGTSGTYGQVTTDSRGRVSAGTVVEDNAHGGTGTGIYTTGDMLYASATNTLSKRTIGSTNQVLTVIGGVPIWQTPATGITEVMTTLGDVDYYTGSARARLAGNTTTSRQFLTSTGNGTISAAPAYYNLFGTNATWTGVQTFTFGAVIGGGSPLNYNFGTFSTNFGAITSTANRTINLPDANGTVGLSHSGSFSGVGTATTTFTVTTGVTEPNNTYRVQVTPTSTLSAALFYVTNKTTTTFDVVYMAGLTGTVTFDWVVFNN